MKIIQTTTTITGVPGYEKIVIEPSEHSASGVHVVIDDGVSPRPFGINEAIELRDALTSAIEHAKHLALALDGSDALTALAPKFTVGQGLDGTEDLPIGTVVEDKDGDTYDRDECGYNGMTLRYLVRQYAPVVIKSLP